MDEKKSKRIYCHSGKQLDTVTFTGEDYERFQIADASEKSQMLKKALGKRSRGKRGGSRRYRGKKRRREWISSSESSETSEHSEDFARKPLLEQIEPASLNRYLGLDYFHVFKGPRDGKIYFVAKEILKDGLGMKGFRGAMQDIPRSEKFRRKVGPGNKKLCISEDGLATILRKSRSDNRNYMIAYLNMNYDVKIPTDRNPKSAPIPKGKEEGISTDPTTGITDAPAHISLQAMESLIYDINENLIKLGRKVDRIDLRAEAASIEAHFAKNKESEGRSSDGEKGKEVVV
jgi:hypothetical protein